MTMHLDARVFLNEYDWCGCILECHVGMLYPEIIGVFLFKIDPLRRDVDEWIWVIVGDLPPAYLTCDICPTPDAAVVGYIGAMEEWVDAADMGKSVANIIPVNVPATKVNAKFLRKKLQFLDENILIQYREDLAHN